MDNKIILKAKTLGDLFLKIGSICKGQREYESLEINTEVDSITKKPIGLVAIITKKGEVKDEKHNILDKSHNTIRKEDDNDNF